MNTYGSWGTRLGRWLVMGWMVACTSPPAAVEPKTQSTTQVTPSVAPPASSELSAALPELATGELKPVEHPQIIPATVVASEQTGGVQTVLLSVPYALLPLNEVELQSEVALREDGGLLSVVGASDEQGGIELWVRRRVPTSGGPSSSSETTRLSGPSVIDVFTPARLGAKPAVAGQHFQVSAELPQGAKADAKLVQRYLSAVANAAGWGSVVHWLLQPASERHKPSGEQVIGDWTELMRLTSGYESVEAALMTTPSMRDALLPQAATLPLKNLTAPALRRHPWATMLKAVPPANVEEPLASLLPADFYFVRARSFDAFQSLIEHIDEVVSPVLGLTTQRREVLDLSDRYRLELGLPQGELARSLGPTLITSLAVAGSDPLLRQGSDVSVLMAVPSAQALLAALAVRRAELGQPHPLTTGTFRHEGIEVKTFSSAYGKVRQHVATHTTKEGQEYVVVSNSPNAIRRIIDVWAGKGDKLGDELDFQYMLRRDAQVTGDVLAYMSDRFVAQVVSPRQRILEVRRQVAKAELHNIGYAALLHAELFGALPADLSALLDKKWGTVRAKHSSGEPITYSPLHGPQSEWGSASRLTSIIDLPTPTRVSKPEKEAYERFVQRYEQRWGENIDPIALRVNTTAKALEAHVRVLPVVNSSDYSDIARFSGGGSVARVPTVEALAGILAIGQQSELRSFLSREGESFLGERLKLDWLGDWVELGLADDALLAKTALAHGDFPAPPGSYPESKDSDFTLIANLPLYLIVDIKSAAGAALLLTTLRELATQAAPDVVSWGEIDAVSEYKIVRVSFDEMHLYYSLSKHRFVLSPDLNTLKRLLQRTSDSPQGTTPGAIDAAQNGGQLVVEVAPRRQSSALRAVVAWLSELAVRENGVHNPLADLMLRAVPDSERDPETYRRLALSHLGGIPVTPDGKLYRRLNSGLLDSARGTAHAPRWPKLPVDGSALEHILRVLHRLRTEVSIDPEPGQPDVTSLRTRLLFER